MRRAASGRARDTGKRSMPGWEVKGTRSKGWSHGRKAKSPVKFRQPPPTLTQSAGRITNTSDTAIYARRSARAVTLFSRKCHDRNDRGRSTLCSNGGFPHLIENRR